MKKKDKTKGIYRSLIAVLCAVLLLVGIGARSVYADEEMPAAPNIEGMTAEEANELIDEYNEKVDEYNEMMEARYEAEVMEVEAHNQAEDEKAEENQKAIEAYENAQAKIESHEGKGITTNRTDDPDELPVEYEVTVEAQDARTIKVEETEDKSGKTVMVMNVHLFFDEGCGNTSTINDLSRLKDDDDVNNHLALAEWETVKVDENDVVTVISEAESMGYRSAAFYKWIEGYTNGYWMPSYSVFGSTAVDSYSTWYKGAAQTASYDMGTTDGRAPVDMFSLYAYTFIRIGAEPEYTEEYVPDYRETPKAPEHLNKMDHIEAQEAVEKDEEPEPEKKEEIIVVPIPEDNGPDGNVPEAIDETPVIKDNATSKKEETVKTEEIIDEIVPLSDVEEFIDDPVPMAAPAAEAHWALLNLIATIATALICLLTILGFFRKEEEKEDEKEDERRNDQYDRDRFLTLVPALLAIVIFILTEDMRLKMVLADKWTLLMGIILIVNIALVLLIRDQKDDEDEETQIPAGSRAILEQ